MAPLDIPSRSGRSEHSSHSYKPQFLSTTPIAEESILRDLEDEDDGGETGPSNGITGSSSAVDLTREATPREYSMAGSYRRCSLVAFAPRPLFPPPADHPRIVSDLDREAALNDERSLLRDNEIIPPKHPRTGSMSSTKGASLTRKLSRGQFIPRRGPRRPSDPGSADEVAVADETTPLVGANPDLPYGGEDSPENIDRKWDEAVAMGMIHTTWQREAKTLFAYSRPLVATFVLQFSLTIVSVFTVGHIGKTELGAVSLGTMSANISGFAIFIGLATSLDTLCPQAYGSGHKKLVGLQVQRMILFLWVIAIPIGCLWAFGPQVLKAIVPEQEIAGMAGRYLQVIIIGLPGYAAFESGKRFTQAQGLFNATLYVLLIAAPLNVFLHWLFVWHFGFGYIGAPMALAIIENLMPVLLFLYVYFVAGKECWTPISRRAFKNWGPMIKLALPGLVMVLAEFLAFEILTLSSAYISATHLATQSILSTISSLAYAIPFPISIAASTRVANLIGATLVDPAKIAARVAFFTAIMVGAFNCLLLVAIRNYVPFLFTNERDVAELTAKVLPINAAFQLFDALAALCNGILRGLGRQEVGGYVNIVCYYLIAMPISFATCFALGWDLYGLWAGPAIALFLVSGIEGWFIYRVDWHKAVEAAKVRNTQG